MIPVLFLSINEEVAYIKLHSGQSEKRLSKNRQKHNRILTILFVLFAALFTISSAMVIKYYLQNGQEEKAFTDLAASVAENSPPYSTPAQQESDIPQYTEYITLYEQNSDFVGWLHIDNTEIDYPVMFTPDEPEYYLRRAFDKSSSQSGTPFVGADSTINSDVFIIYGHNMKNDTMFGTLDNYAKKDFWVENPFISFTTVTEHRNYEVFAAMETRILSQGETGYRYYSQVGNLTEEAFDELIRWFQQNDLYDTDITPEYGEQIVILSTCSYHEENGRFIIGARRTT